MSRQGASLRSPERFVFLIALNAVYLVGPLFFGWTVGTVLLLFWFEAVITALTAAVRLHRHRAHRPVRGHFRRLLDGENPTASGSFLTQFLQWSMLLSGVYGVFLFVMVFGFGREGAAAWQIDLGDLLYGMRWIVIVELAQLAVDLVGIRHRTFAWVRAHADRAYGSIFVQHFVVVLGLMLLAVTLGSAVVFLALLVVLKAVVDWALSGGGTREEPPPLFRWLAEKKGKDIDAFWASQRVEQMRLAEENEQRVAVASTETPESSSPDRFLR